MLNILRIKNLAIVDELEIELNPGLTVITGETGAGKSILVKAIELLSGKRAQADLIRSGNEYLSVEAQFSLNKKIVEKLHLLSDEFAEINEGDDLLLKRVLDKNGRSKIYFNGSLITASISQQMSPLLLDITSQHEQQILLDQEAHLDLLDSFGVSEDLRTEVASAFMSYSEAKNALDAFFKKSHDRENYIKRIREEEAELKKSRLVPGEKEQLEAELNRASHIEILGTKITDAVAILENSEDNILEKLSSVEIYLSQCGKLDEKLNEPHSMIENAQIQISEALLFLNDYLSTLEANPERLEFLRSRISELARLERKYEKNVSELCAYLVEISKEIIGFESGALNEKKLKDELNKKEIELRRVEKILHQERKSVAEKLSKAVESELKSLEMKRAKFIINVTQKESSIKGADRVEFMLSANPGEPPRALSKVASGGELSRILLAVKTLLGEVSGAATQIFDEVDTGIGGAVSQVVGEKLLRLSKSNQVIVITHAPQIAAFADNHLLISKSQAEKSTVTTVSKLKNKESINEIARMLAGKNVTTKFTDSAKQLIEEAKSTTKL